MMTDEDRKFLSDLKSRINPAYANQRGTESYERRMCVELIERLALEQASAHMDDRTIHRLQRGEIAEPKFSQGLALLDLHVKWCAEKHDFKKIGKGCSS